MTNCTGWMCLRESPSSSASWRTYRCLHGQAPRYLADHIKPAIEVASRSANRHRLIVPRCRLNTYGRRAFPVAGPTVWTHCQMNSEIQRATLTVSNSSLKQSCSVSTSVTSALEVNLNNMRYINLHFTLLYFTLLTWRPTPPWSASSQNVLISCTDDVLHPPLGPMMFSDYVRFTRFLSAPSGKS